MNQRSLQSEEIKCVCSETAKKPLIAFAGCSDDLAAVSALPDNLVPRKCGPTLINFLKNREMKHESVLNNLLDEAKSINNDINTKVRNIAEILLSDIQASDADIKKIIAKYKSNNLPLSVEDRNNALKEITKISVQRTENLAKFKLESLALEGRRADKLKMILKRQFQHLITVGHKPPSSLLHEFDEQMYDINHQLLSNSRAYMEVEAQFRLQLEERIVHAHSVINEFCLKSESSPLLKHANFGKQSSAEYEKNQISKDVLNLDQVKKNVSEILEAYNTACSIALHKISVELDTLYNSVGNRSNNLLNNRSSFEVLNLNNIVSDTFGLLSKYNEQYNNEDLNNICKIIETDGLNLQKILTSLFKSLHDIYLILSELCRICNDHDNRLSLVQKFMMLSLDDTQTTFDAIELSNEVNFNIALEQMRCAPDFDKLQQQFEVINNYLNKKGDTFCQQKEAEYAKIEDFMKFTLTMFAIISSEFSCLLDKLYNKAQPLDTPITSADSTSNFQEVLSLRAPILQTILQTQLQEQEINVCINNYLESFDNILLLISEYLNGHSRKWVDEKCSLVNMRCSLKAISHSIRKERIEAASEARLAEIRFHESRLNSHLDAMYNIIDRLPIEASEFKAIDAPDLYPFTKWIKTIKTNMDMLLVKETIDPEFKRLKMTSYAYRLGKHRQLFEESLDSAINDYKDIIKISLQKARMSNVKFMSRIKLFFEGGKFAAAEAIKSCAALVKAGDALESCSSRTMDVLNQRRNQLLALADQQIAPLQRVVEDFVKYAAKNTFDKKKMPPNRSK